MSGMFKMLEGELSVVYESGVYKEAQLATRNGELYVKAKGGFVRLYADGTTSAGSKMFLDTITLEGPFYKDRFGKLCIEPAADRKPLEAAKFITQSPDADASPRITKED